jgi:Gram-negative bacterial TonB protein C-terminal/Sel1 repeat
MTERLGIFLLSILVVGSGSAAFAAQDTSPSWKAQVSKAILEGRCDEAKSIALQANDLDVAEQALRLCKPASTAGSRSLDTDTQSVSPLTAQQMQDKMDMAFRAYVYDKNYAEAFKTYTELSTLGNKEAKIKLANMYVLGRGVDVDENKALEYLKDNLYPNNIIALNQIGIMFLNGSGVQKNYVKARKWFELAAKAGNPDAQFNMGLMFQNGWGGPREITEALKWYKLSAAQGYKYANDNISNLIVSGLATESDRPSIKISGNRSVLLVSRPSLSQMQAFYPSKATNEKVQAIADVECLINIEGIATNCSVLSETPEGYDFGLATIRVLRTSTFAPAVSGGVAVEAKYKHRIRWTAPKSLLQKLEGPVSEDTVVCRDGTLQTYASGGPFCSSHGGAKNVRLKDN